MTMAMDDGEFFLYDLDYSILQAVLFVAQLCLGFCFWFEVKSE